jgi:ankyrin repeat protein
MIMPIDTADKLKALITDLMDIDPVLKMNSSNDLLNVEDTVKDIQSINSELINTQNDEGITLLMAAIRTGIPEIVEAVLAKNPNLELADLEGDTAIQHAFETWDDMMDGTSTFAVTVDNLMLDKDTCNEEVSATDPRIGVINIIHHLLDKKPTLNLKNSAFEPFKEHLKSHPDISASTHPALHQAQHDLLARFSILQKAQTAVSSSTLQQAGGGAAAPPVVDTTEETKEESDPDRSPSPPE